jgi:Ca2+-transporting ATPase
VAAAAASPNPWSVETLHAAVPGRARFRVRVLRSNPSVARRCALALQGLDGVLGVRVSAATGTMLLRHDPDEPLAALQTRVAACLSALLERPVNATSPEAVFREQGPAPDLARSIAEFLQPREQAPPAQAQAARNWHAMAVEEVLEALGASAEQGLDAAEAKRRLQALGGNRMPELVPPSALETWLRQFTTVPVAMLAGSGAVALATGGVVDAAAIAVVTVANSIIAYRTERESERTIAALATGTPKTVTVRRGGRVLTRAITDLVPGDLVPLQPGTWVPADARIVSNHHLMTDESTLTGESMPVLKRARLVCARGTPLADRRNMVFGGTTVTGGSGRAVVVATGRYSELGRVQEAAGRIEVPETPLQKQLGKMGANLALLSALACAGVFGIGFLRRQPTLELLKSSISLGVAAIPEGLPTVATTTLALGVREMSRRKVTVRNLDAVEALGAVTVFCLDKTGTLTENRMQTEAVYADGLRMSVHKGRWSNGAGRIAPRDSATRRRLLDALVLCNESTLERNGSAARCAGTPTENALLQLAVDAGVDVDALRRRHPTIKTRYRSEKRHYMVTHHRAGKRRLVVVKGSPADTLALCSRFVLNGRPRRLDNAVREEFLRENERWANEALRVLAVATARVGEGDDWRDDGLTLLGLVGMADPLREGMTDVIARLQRAGIRTVMITGDQSPTAYAVGKQLNISGGEELKTLDAAQLDQLPPELRDALALKTHVFARVSPGHKLEIVRTFQRAGEVVAMTGDGVNDGPALRAADVGVAMGGANQDVARSLSDVVLEDDRLATMQTAVAQGRTIYSNIRKALQFLLSTNFSEIEVMLAAVALGLAPPLNPMQLLWINLVSDVFPGLALALEPPEDGVMQRPPRSADAAIIQRDDLARMGVESAVISAGTLGAYAWGLLRYGSGARASGLAFHTLTVAQLLHALLCRSEDGGLYKRGRPRNRYLDLALGVSLAAHAGTALLPPLRRLMGAAPLSFADLPVLAAGTLGPLLINDRLKRRADTADSPSETEPEDTP